MEPNHIAAAVFLAPVVLLFWAMIAALCVGMWTDLSDTLRRRELERERYDG